MISTEGNYHFFTTEVHKFDKSEHILIDFVIKQKINIVGKVPNSAFSILPILTTQRYLKEGDDSPMGPGGRGSVDI